MSKEERRPASFELPDLELPAPAPSRPGAQLHRPGLLSHDDDFELIAGGTSLELAEPVRHGEPPSARVHPAPGWPSGQTPSAERLAIDPHAVLAVAAYPSAEGPWLSAPAYAWATFRRRRQLKRLTAERLVELHAAERARDYMLAEIARELADVIAAHPTAGARMSALRELEPHQRKRHEELTNADRDYRQRAAEYERARAERQREHEAAQRAQAVTDESFAAADNDFRRILAQQQRLEIESRGVHELIRRERAREGDPPAPAHVARLDKLSAKVRELAPELARSREDAERAQSARAASARATEQLAADLRRFEREQAAQAAELEKQLRMRQRGLRQAEIETQAAWTELGRHVLAARGAVPVPAPRLSALREREDVVDRMATELELHVRAQSAFDHARARGGVRLVAVAFLVLLLAVTLRAML